MHLGRDRVICAYVIDGLIVDPGPASCVETLIDRLGPVEPRALLLTHIHLDHAGATGVLCRRYPKLKVYVHERGAPHLVDPSKLLASAARLYGDDMEELWGEVDAGAGGADDGRSRAARGSRASGWPTRRGTPRTTSATSTRSRVTPTSATWPASASRRTAHGRAHAAAGHRRRGLARLAAHRRGVESAVALPHPLRSGHGRGRPAPPDPLRAHGHGRLGPRGRRGALHRPARGRSVRRRRPGGGGVLRAGRAAWTSCTRASSATGESGPRPDDRARSSCRGRRGPAPGSTTTGA